MIKTVLGILVLLLPFLLISRFKDKKVGFVYILSFLIAFHSILAIITQAFRIFTYQIVMIVSILSLVIVLFKSDVIKLFKDIKSIRIDWVLVLVTVILFIHLFSVHYNYSGKVIMFEGGKRVTKDVVNMKYRYPYVSDEWYAISLAKYSIASRSLPFSNPLSENTELLNFEFPFHSLIAEQFLLLDLDPLEDYTKITIFSGLLVCILVYVFLRISWVDRFPAGIASLSILYITNGANLPGIWNLMPFIIGSIFLLLFFIFFTLDIRPMILFTLVFTLLFYPPLMVFCFAALVSKLMRGKKLSRERNKQFIYYLLFAALVGVVVSLALIFEKLSFIDFIKHILSRIFYSPLTPGSIPGYYMLKIVPWYVVILSFFGLLYNMKRRMWSIYLLVLGLVYWLIYSFAMFRFIIEYQRVVFVTSILFIIFSGFGLHYITRYLINKKIIRRKIILNCILLGVILLFFIFYFGYTSREHWKDLVLVNQRTGAMMRPAAPANNYLHPDDLKLFEGIKEKNFLSIPWKGTVIGVATDNYPVETKEGTISNNPGLYNRYFIKASCDKKQFNINKYGIDYVYIEKTDCPDWDLIGISSEGLYLYKV